MKTIIKKFTEWIVLKERLHHQEHKQPFVSERDIWWVSIGENIGSEVNGKSAHFTRPALVLKKLAHGFYLVAPTTTQARQGTWYTHVRLAGVDELSAFIKYARWTIGDCTQSWGKSIRTISKE